MTSGRYGSYMLPLTIDAEEFEAILRALAEDHNELRNEIDGYAAQQRKLDEEKDKVDSSDGRGDASIFTIGWMHR